MLHKSLSTLLPARLIITCAALLLSACSNLSHTPLNDPGELEKHYRIYRSDGTPATLEALIKETASAQVTFLGEQHDDAVAHHLEALIVERRWQPGLALSLEMFESDVQYVLDEYLEGHISEDHFKSSARAWSDYDTDYRPMIEFSKEKEITVIAANAPRRYVNMITRSGEDSLLALDDKAQSLLPPLPHAEARPEYAQKFLALMGQSDMQQTSQDDNEIQKEDGQHQQTEDKPGVAATDESQNETAVSTRPDPQKMLRAQSMWDASMAWSISQHLQAHPESKVIHVNGSFHSAERMGIPDHLLSYREGTSFLVVTMLYSETFPEFDPENMNGQGDFVIVTKP